MQTRIWKSGVCLLAVVCFLIPSVTHSAPARSTTGSLSTLVSGTLANAAGSFTGLLNINNFTVQNGTLMAVGTLTGTLTDPLGNTIGTITNQAVTMPVASVQATCPILSLTLGPLNLNLLGLNVSLNQVVLNITAVPGAGNLLGNLLCSVAGLLNGGGPLPGLLQGVASLLNQILAAL
jgi:hypothetical protein